MMKLRLSKKSEVNKDEDDSINIMLGEDEDNLFDDEKKEPSRNLLATLPKTASPPRPETAPVVTPFTSKDTISLASRNNKAPSENSSMRVAIDESESVGTQESVGDGKDDKSKDAESSKNGDASAKEKESANGKSEEGENESCALWVSGLSNTVRAMDLKNTFAKYGKVTGAKVVSSARTPGARCYGYVTMGTVEEALKCMSELNKTELNGKVITIERDKKGSSGMPPKPSSNSSRSSQDSKPKSEATKSEEDSSKTEKKDEPRKSTDRSATSDEKTKRSRSRDRSRDREHRGR